MIHLSGLRDYTLMPKVYDENRRRKFARFMPRAAPMAIQGHLKFQSSPMELSNKANAGGETIDRDKLLGFKISTEMHFKPHHICQ